jgi:exodeoxyribonuclease VII large subunit
MGADSEAATEVDLASLQERLDTEAVTFVDTVNEEVSTLVDEADHLRFDYVVGDVSSASVAASGHQHFDLVHNGSSIHCVCFQSRRPTIQADIDDGLQIAVKGDLSFYEPEGKLSVIVKDIVTVGEGQYQQLYEQNRQLLADDGLLDPATKQELPALPQCVGLVTSADSDAREDAVTSIHSRYPDVDIIVHDTAVQGDEAMTSMMQAISVLDDDATVDVIVLTRGGGADKQLRVFNETPLCRVVHNAATPVVVGVGHENDRTLADEVADKRVMTPTDIGGIVPDKTAIVDDIETLAQRLATAYETTTRATLDEYERSLTHRYQDHVAAAVTEYRTDLDRAYDAVASHRLQVYEHWLSQAHETHMVSTYTGYRTDLDHAYDSVVRATLTSLESDLTHAFESHKTTSVATLQADLDRAYASRVRSEYSGLQSGLDQAYEQLVTERLTTLQNRLDSARDQYDERREHRQQTDAYQRQRRLLIAALLVLGLAVVGLAAYILLL